MVVEATEPLDRAKVIVDVVYPLPDDWEISYPVGGVKTISAVKSDPETVNDWALELLPEQAEKTESVPVVVIVGEAV